MLPDFLRALPAFERTTLSQGAEGLARIWEPCERSAPQVP